MANIVIKKNFIDGDKLFAQQLNNNFETIEKGINDGNKIVWQDGTEVKFKRYVTDDIDSLPILDGSIIYDTEKGRHYIDYQGKRVQVGSAGKEVLVQEEQPTEEDNKIWIESDFVNTMGTEITNEHSDSKIMGYSADYLNNKIMNEEGSWTPVVKASYDTAPTVTYEKQVGYYKKIGKMVYVEFYITGKVTALNGTKNQGIITGLPYPTHSNSNFGQSSLHLGTHYNLIENPDTLTLIAHVDTIYLQTSLGAGAGKLKNSLDSYFTIGGSGWYMID